MFPCSGFDETVPFVAANFFVATAAAAVDSLKAVAWFVAVAPADMPKIAVAVLIEHGGHGGSAAAPIAKELIKAYLGVPS